MLCAVSGNDHIASLMSGMIEQLLETIRCPRCHGHLSCSPTQANADSWLLCSKCQEQFPVIDGIPRLLVSPLREALLGNREATGMDAVQSGTAGSFGFEWHRFPEMYEEWEQNFANYMNPHKPEFFRNKKVLDAGCGNGRFAYYAAKYGAEVWAIDLSQAVTVARRNTEKFSNVRVIQADLHCPPFAPESFDFIYSIGVLHHLPDPEVGFQNLLKFLKPGGEIQIYLYWSPEGQPLKRAMLAAVAAGRQITTRLPHSVVYGVAFPASVLAFLIFVWPYQILRRIPRLRGLAEKLPMKQYASFPFRVCVNDQFDRLSAPIENRYRRQEVEDWLKRAGLENTQVLENFGWVASGQKPVGSAASGCEHLECQT